MQLGRTGTLNPSSEPSKAMDTLNKVNRILQLERTSEGI